MSKTGRILSALRSHMVRPAINVQAYIIPTDDQHMNEYIAPQDGRREYVSGFTGSAGTAIVTMEQAALFTDGRYHTQAAIELDSNWTLIKSGTPGAPSQHEWLTKTLASKSRVGIDPTLISSLDYSSLAEKLANASVDLVSVEENIVDEIWKNDGKPAPSLNPIFELPIKYSGVSVHDKLASIQSKLHETHSSCLILSCLDEIAWLFNLRGSDIPCNPVFYAFAVVCQDSTILYTRTHRFPQSARAHLPHVVEIKEYEQFLPDLRENAATWQEQGKIWIGPSSPQSVAGLFDKDKLNTNLTPTTIAKAIKNETELQGMRNCHVRDAAALCDFFSWLETQFQSNPSFSLNEFEGAEKLEEFRRAQSDFLSVSFPSILGSGSNAAIIHYHPPHQGSASLTTNKIILLDSGGQYRDGTTDVTRTIHLGTPSEHEIHCFTLVLKGHIQLSLSTFPNGTPGRLLDTIARMPLWKAGLEYRHGTGHGVGHCLNVHEGPFGIGSRDAHMLYPLNIGNIVTNEPGYYEEGQFGVRIENVMEVIQQNTQFNFDGMKFNGLRPVTLVPYQRKLINVSLLTQEEMDWVNQYHQRCYEVVGDYLNSLGNKTTQQWLHQNTRPL